MAKGKQRNMGDLGIVAPEKKAELPLSVRLSERNLRKLAKLGRHLKVGPSTMARLIVEKFIKEHDPDGQRDREKSS
jgi:hypothetical protein